MLALSSNHSRLMFSKHIFRIIQVVKKLLWYSLIWLIGWSPSVHHPEVHCSLCSSHISLILVRLLLSTPLRLTVAVIFQPEQWQGAVKTEPEEVVLKFAQEQASHSPRGSLVLCCGATESERDECLALWRLRMRPGSVVSYALLVTQEAKWSCQFSLNVIYWYH